MEKTIKTNNTLIVLTVLLYFTFWGGILSQIALGFFHIIIFLRLVYKWNLIADTLKVHLSIYGIITSLLILLTFIKPETFIGAIWIGSVPLVVYFTYILHQLKHLKLWS